MRIQTSARDVIKTCSCGRAYDAHEWERLPPPPNGAHQSVPAFGDEPGYTLEYRNCTCGSTIAIELKGEEK